MNKIEVKTRLFVMLTLLSFFCGCSEDDSFYLHSDSALSRSTSGSTVPDYFDRKIGVGWGYDCNTYYGDPKGVRDQIFNATRIKALAGKYEGNLFVTDESYNMADSYVNVGENSTDYSEKLGVQASVGVGFPFAFSLDVTARFEQSDMESNNCYFATKRYKYVMTRRTMNIENIMTAAANHEPVFTEGFEAYLQKLSYSRGRESDIKDFVRTFGNTYVYSSDVGGRLDYNMSVAKSSSLSEEEVGISVEANLLSMFSISVSETQKNAMLKTNENSKTSVSAKGGDVSILGKALLNGEQCDEATLQKWTSSINSANSQMVDCRLRPIWELIADEEVAIKVRNYILGKRVDDDGLSFPQPKVPHYSFNVPAFDENGTLVKVAWAYGKPLVEFCREVVPKYGAHRVTMAYPVINNVTDYSKGIYVGDNSSVYLDGSYLSVKPIENITYSEGQPAFDVTLLHSGKTYRLVKIGENVWTRDNYATTVSNAGDEMPGKSGGLENYVRYDKTYLFYNRGKIDFKDYLPVNWRLPSSEDVRSMNTVFNTSDPYFQEGSSGLDLSIVNVYDIKETVFLVSDTYGKLLRFTRLDMPEVVANTVNPGIIRMIRSSTYRYN